MNITIAGCGKVGSTLAMQLSKEGHDITVIDIKGDRLEYLNNTQDVMCVAADAKSVSALKSAGVDKSNVILAMTDDDEDNLMVCLIAKNLGVSDAIARVRNPIYEETIGVIKDDLGLSMAVNPELEAAREMFRTLRFKSAGQIETFAKSRTEIMTCVISEGMPICNEKIKNIYEITKAKVFICAIKRNGEVFIPNGETDILPDDTLSFVANHKDATKFFKKLGYDTGRVKDLSIIGGGRLGYYLGKMAVENGIPTKIVDKNMDVCKKLDVMLPGADIICGDATSTDVIEEENILSSSAIAVLTGEDSTNTLISMYIKQKCPEMKLITKIKKSDFEDMLYNINVGNIFNPKYITADHVIRYIRAMRNAESDEVKSLCHVIDNKVEVLEFVLNKDTPNLGRQLKELKIKKDILIANIYRDGKAFIPGGSDELKEKDIVLIVTTRTGICKFSEIFE